MCQAALLKKEISTKMASIDIEDIPVMCPHCKRELDLLMEEEDRCPHCDGAFIVHLKLEKKE